VHQGEKVFGGLFLLLEGQSRLAGRGSDPNIDLDLAAAHDLIQGEDHRRILGIARAVRLNNPILPVLGLDVVVEIDQNDVDGGPDIVG